MAYEKQTWGCNDDITADKLNHMEDGIESASQVEKIRLGTFTVYSSEIASSPWYAFGGGGMLENSQTLADLVGDKTIINYDVKHYSTGSSASETEFVCDVQTSGGTDYNRIPLLIFPKEHYDKIGALNISGLITGREASAVQAVEIYAICI